MAVYRAGKGSGGGVWARDYMYLLVSFPDPTLKEEKRVWGLGAICFARLTLGECADTAALKQTLDLIGQ